MSVQAYWTLSIFFPSPFSELCECFFSPALPRLLFPSFLGLSSQGKKTRLERPRGGLWMVLFCSTEATLQRSPMRLFWGKLSNVSFPISRAF